MGKAKKEKARLRQARQKAKEAAGGGLPSSPSPSLLAPVESPAQRQQLLETLTSGTPTQKAVACHAVAHQVSNAAQATSSSPFLQPQLLSRLLALLFAADYDARFAASVAIHALSSMSQRACAALVKQDALIACLSLLSHPSLLPLDGPRRDRLLVEAVGIIRDLTENVESVLVEMSASAVALRCLFALLAPQQEEQGRRGAAEGGRLRLQLEVASLLLQMTEQNEPLVSAISSAQSAVSLLLSLMADQPACSLLRLTVAGIVLNLQTPQHIRLLTSASSPFSSSASSISPQSSSSTPAVPAAASSVVPAAVALLSSALQEDVAALSRDYLQSMRAERERLQAVLTELDGTRPLKAKEGELADAEREVEMKEGEAEETVMTSEAETKAMQAEPSMEVEEMQSSAGRKRELRANDVERDAQRRMELLTTGWQDRVNAVKLALELLSNLTAEEEEEEDEAQETKQPSREEKETAVSPSWLSQVLVAADSFSHAARLLDSELRVDGHQSERELVSAMIGDDYGDDCLALLTSLRCRAASFLTNLVLYLPPAAVAPHFPAIMQRCSQRLTQLLSTPASVPSAPASACTSESSSLSPSSSSLRSSDAGLEEMESLTGLFFVISKSQHIAASAASNPLFSASQLQSLLQLLTLPSTAPSIRLSLLDIAAVVASHPASASLCVEPVTAAVLSLLRPCCSSSSAEATELLDRCLNVLMDCYAEDGLHGEVLGRLAVLPALQEAAAAMQRLAGSKGGRQERGEDRRRHLETVNNVREFLRYKPQHI